MVVFTCNHCGDSLQKPKVEKHYQYQCRNSKNLTCVDCHKDFIGEDYMVHIKCVSEEERYGAKGASNNTVKKGEVKQESWITMIQSIIAAETNIKPHLKRLLETISKYNNIPRKKNKFFNFMKNAHGNKIAEKDVVAIWNIIEKHKTSSTQNGKNDEKSTNGEVDTNENHGNISATNTDEMVNKKKKRKVDSNETENVAGEEIEKPKKKKKAKNDCELLEITENNKTNKLITETTEAENNTTTGKFDYEAKILDILNNKNTVSLEKLEKKVIKLYSKEKGEVDNLQKVSKKLHKKLNKMSNIVIENDTVTLKT